MTSPKKQFFAKCKIFLEENIKEEKDLTTFEVFFPKDTEWSPDFINGFKEIENLFHTAWIKEEDGENFDHESNLELSNLSIWEQALHTLFLHYCKNATISEKRMQQMMSMWKCIS